MILFKTIFSESEEFMLLYEEILYEYIEFKNPKKKTEKGKILEIIYAKLIRVISNFKNLLNF